MSGNRKKGKFIALFTVILIAALSYCSNLKGELLFDDSIYTSNSPLTHWETYSVENLLALKSAPGFTARPVTILSFAIAYPFFNGSLLSYHIFSILAHIGVGLLLFFLIRQLIQLDRYQFVSRENSFVVALLSSLICLVHPLNSQAVNYVIQRSVLLSTFFYLLALIYFIKLRCAARDRDKTKVDVAGYLVIVVGAFVLAMGSKATAVTFPVVCLLLELMFFHHLSAKKTLKLISLIVAITVPLLVTFSLWRGGLVNAINKNYNLIEGDLPRYQHFLTGCRAVFVYLKHFFWPDISQLRLEYSFPVSTSLFSPITTFLALSGLVSALVIAFKLFYRKSLISFAIFFFLGNMVLETFIIKLDLIYEHRAYQPTLFLAFVIVALIYGSEKNDKRKLTLLLGILIAVLAVLTNYHSKIWKSSVTVYDHNVKLSPNHDRVVLNCFVQNMEIWRPGVNEVDHELVIKAERALLKRLKKSPNSLNENLAISYLYLMKQKFDKADQHFKHGLNHCTNQLMKKKFLLNQLNKLRRLERYQNSLELINYYKKFTSSSLVFDLHYGFNCILLNKEMDIGLRINSKTRSRDELLFIYKKLGYFCFFSERKTEALNYYDLSYELNPDDKEVNAFLALLRKADPEASQQK